MTNLEAYNEMMNDMVDINFVFDVAKMNKVDELVNNFNVDMNRYIEDFARLGLAKVKVEKGRKWKGEGWLVGFYESSFSTGYRNINTKHAKIYDPNTNRIETVPLYNVTIIDTSKILEAYKKAIEFNINSASVDNTSFARYIEAFPILLPCLNSFSIDILKAIDEELNSKNIGFSYWARGSEFMNEEIDLENAIDEEENYKKSKKEAFKAKKMPELIEWVKTHTDKKGEEINKLAEHIFNKKYGD